MTGTFGDYLRERRLAVDVSMGQLARQSGFSHGYISLIEAGQRNPRAGTVKKLLVALAELEAAKTVAA